MQAIKPETSHKLANMSFLCATFVIIIHVWQPEPVGSVAWWLYSLTSCRSIAVPFFFLMSGYLLAGHIGEDDWWRRENLKRIKTLLVPYVCWSVIWSFFLIARQTVDNIYHDDWILRGYRSIASEHTFLGLELFTHPQLATLWYVRSLLIFVFCSPILIWALKRNTWLVLGLSFIKLLLYRGESFGTWYYLVDRMFSFGFLFYFLLGMALRKGLVPTFKKNYTIVAGALAVILWALIYGTRAFVFEDIATLPRIVRFAYGRLGTIETMLWMYFIWMIIPTRQLPKIFANTSFAIYLVHWFVLVGVWQRYMYCAPRSSLELIMSSSVGILGTLTIVIAMKKIAPKISSVLFGGRS